MAGANTFMCAVLYVFLPPPPPPPQVSPWRKRQDSSRLAKYLQRKRNLLATRNEFGIVLPDAPAKSKEIAGPWRNTMPANGTGAAGCNYYPQNFFGNKNWFCFAKALTKPVDTHLVLAVLNLLSKSPSPGVDGVPAPVYPAFRGLFAPHMLHIFTTPWPGVSLLIPGLLPCSVPCLSSQELCQSQSYVHQCRKTRV